MTLHQPWASLVAVGAKTIETRSWSTTYRGPLLIHAAARKPDVEMLEDGYAGEIGDVDARWFQWCQSEDDPRPDEWWLYDCTSADVETPTPGAMWNMPLGAVVASCQLIDCVPIVDGLGGVDDPLPRVCNCIEWDKGLRLMRPFEYPSEDVSAQLPFGDFSPGRWAWLLDDVKPTTERCPRCWGRPKRPDVRIEGGSRSCWHCNRTLTFNMMRDDGGDCDCREARAESCPTCLRASVCEPVPMGGKQGLWTPAWEIAA